MKNVKMFFGIFLLYAGCLALSATAGILAYSADGGGWLEQNGEYRVLHLEGAPYEMGFQHGEIMGSEVHDTIQAYVYDWAIGDNGITLEEIDAIIDAFFPFIPQKYIDEMQGVADGSGADCQDLWRLHAIPSRYHCCGIAGWGDATSKYSDGALHHCRSLDYPLDIGDLIQPQDVALVIVRNPADGVASAVPSWSGFIGNVGGLNSAGISVGEMGSGSNDETYAGLPMIFRLARVLDETETIEEALAVMEENCTRGYNFIVGDGKIPVAYAVETTAGEFYAGTWDDPTEGTYPHWRIKDSVRRTNHFVDPATAATQRDPYDSLLDPEGSYFGSYLHYFALSKLYQTFSRRGVITGPILKRLLTRGYQKADRIGQELFGEQVTVMYQAVFSPTTGDFWVAYAEGDSSAMWFPGEWYNIYDLLDSQP